MTTGRPVEPEAERLGTVRVRLFASLRELAGTDELEVPAGSARTVGDLWRTLVARVPALEGQAPSAAVNAAYAAKDTLLNGGDEVAFLPPVSGG